MSWPVPLKPHDYRYPAETYVVLVPLVTGASSVAGTANISVPFDVRHVDIELLASETTPAYQTIATTCEFEQTPTLAPIAPTVTNSQGTTTTLVFPAPRVIQGQKFTFTVYYAATTGVWTAATNTQVDTGVVKLVFHRAA